MKTLGLIGFGRFGQLAAQMLHGRFAISASDQRDQSAVARSLGVSFVDIHTAARCDIVVISVPVQNMLSAIKSIAPVVRPGSLVVDVASVKVFPAAWMTEHLPESVDVVATHPLFGPQSAKLGLVGQRLIVCPVRGRAHEAVARLGRRIGLSVHVTTPEQHDLEMSYVQALSHLIGRALINISAPAESLSTRSYEHLLDLCSLIKDDSFELFSAIQTMNPYASGVTRDFLQEAARLLEEANQRRDAATEA